MFDIIIIGKGPAGISAALNASIRNKNVLLFGNDSNKVNVSPHINNYLGLPELKGPEIYRKFTDHLGMTNVVTSSLKVTSIYSMGTHFTVQAGTEMYEAKSVILAMGVDFKKTIEAEDVFLGMGVSYCATCDGPLYKGKTVCVIGYNKEAFEETNFLAELCEKVYLVPLIECEATLKGNVQIIKDIPLRFEGKMKAEKLVMKDSFLEADGFFVIKDSYPITALVPGINGDGSHVIVNRTMETNIKGLFAAGDITGKPYQIAKSVGEGQVAALNAVDFISKL